MTTAVSLFAGIGGFDLALARQDVRVTAAAEIDKDCRGVLARHFPEMTLFSDVQEITGGDLIETGFEPEAGILTAGWPCQGNSVAGRRGGLGDPRSGLWGEVARLLGETRPKWFVGENVPGLLTVNRGRDFGIILRTLDELGYGYCWRVLDAQYFGVPQRRKRVLLVGCLGDGASPAEILLEPESGGRYLAPGTQAGARVAGTLAASAGGGGLGGIGQSASAITSRIVEVVSTLQGGGKRGYRVDAESAAGGHLLPVAHTLTSGVAAKPGVNPPGRRSEDDYNLVVHPLRETGARIGAAEDTSKEGRDLGAPDDPSYTLRNGGTPHGVVVTANTAYALSAHHGHDDRENNYVIGFATSSLDCPRDDGQSPPLKANLNGQGTGSGPSVYASIGMAVRRLTPRECERLQGFPDDWTAGQSDSARYRQLGNAVAVPVIEWVTRRLLQVQSTCTDEREAA